MRRAWFLWACVGWASLGVSACGYQIAGVGAPLWPTDVGPVSLSVPPFDNRSSELRLSTQCARALQDRLVAAGAEPEDETRARVLFVGVVLSSEERPLAVQGHSAQREVEAELLVQVQVQARAWDGWLVYDSGPVEGRRTYSASGSPTEISAERQRAAQAACEDAVEDVSDDFLARVADGQAPMPAPREDDGWDPPKAQDLAPVGQPQGPSQAPPLAEPDPNPAPR